MHSAGINVADGNCLQALPVPVETPSSRTTHIGLSLRHTGNISVCCRQTEEQPGDLTQLWKVMGNAINSPEHSWHKGNPPQPHEQHGGSSGIPRDPKRVQETLGPASTPSDPMDNPPSPGYCLLALSIKAKGTAGTTDKSTKNEAIVY